MAAVVRSTWGRMSVGLHDSDFLAFVLRPLPPNVIMGRLLTRTEARKFVVRAVHDLGELRKSIRGRVQDWRNYRPSVPGR